MLRSTVVAVILATASLATAGCAADPPPAPVAGPEVPRPASPVSSGPGGSATLSRVAISDDIRSRCGISDSDAYFGFDSARVSATDRSPLDLVARCFATGPLAGRTVKLVGRADPRGSAEYNMTLGQSRADAVGVYLVAKGLPSAHETSTSRGAVDASGSDARGWARDRRVDVLLGD